MAEQLRRTNPMAKYIADGVNGNRSALGAGSSFHLDAFETPVSAADAGTTDLPATIALTNQIKSIFNLHIVDLLAHGGADSADLVATETATDQTTVIALALALAAAYELHRVKTAGSVHYNADSTNTLTSTTVTTLAQAATVMTDMKAKLNAHMASAPAGHSMRLVAG